MDWTVINTLLGKLQITTNYLGLDEYVVLETRLDLQKTMSRYSYSKTNRSKNPSPPCKNTISSFYSFIVVQFKRVHVRLMMPIKSKSFFQPTCNGKRYSPIDMDNIFTQDCLFAICLIDCCN